MKNSSFWKKLEYQSLKLKWTMYHVAKHSSYEKIITRTVQGMFVKKCHGPK